MRDMAMFFRLIVVRMRLEIGILRGKVCGCMNIEMRTGQREVLDRVPSPAPSYQ